MKIAEEGYCKAVAVAREGEDGTHTVRWGKSDKGTKSVMVYFELLDGPDRGTVLPWWGYFTNKTSERTVESLRFMGFKGDDLFKAGEQELDQVVQVLVEHNTYEGKTRARIAFVNAMGGGAMTLKNPLSDKDVRAFAATMKNSCKKVSEHDGDKAGGGDYNLPGDAGGGPDPVEDDAGERAGAPDWDDDL